MLWARSSWSDENYIRLLLRFYATHYDDKGKINISYILGWRQKKWLSKVKKNKEVLYLHNIYRVRTYAPPILLVSAILLCNDDIVTPLPFHPSLLSLSLFSSSHFFVSHLLSLSQASSHQPPAPLGLITVSICCWLSSSLSPLPPLSHPCCSWCGTKKTISSVIVTATCIQYYTVHSIQYNIPMGRT